MGDGDALLRAILERPECDTARLVYADWLDEQGDHARAEFIRVQVELSRVMVHRGGRSFAECAKCGIQTDHYGGYTKRCRGRVCRLRRREYYTSRQHIVWDWCGGVHGGWARTIHLSSWSRGFAHTVTCTQTDFLAHARDIFAAHPVERVTLTDVVIFPSSGNHTFYVGGLGRFPQEYWSRLDSLPTRAAALDALSDVCVALGRKLAAHLSTS